MAKTATGNIVGGMTDSSPGKVKRSVLVRRIGLGLGPVWFVLAMILPLPALPLDDGMVVADSQIRVVLGLAGWMAIWWMTEALPLAATSLMPLIILPVSGVVPATRIAPQYFADIVVLFLGGFCIALAMQKAGLHRRIALRVIKIMGTKPRRLVFGFLVAAAILSMWVSNTATTLMLIPVVLTIVHDTLPQKDRSDVAKRFAAACLLAVAFGASLGGVATTIGTPPNAFFQGFFNQRFAAEIAAGELPEITFGRWMTLGVPLAVVLVPACWLLLTRLSPGVPKLLPEFDGDSVRDRIKPESGPSIAEIAVMVVFFATVFMWVTHSAIRIGNFQVPLTGWNQWFAYGTGSAFISDGTIAVAAAMLLFVLPDFKKGGERLLTWEFAAPRLPWGALLLFGGGLALAFSFGESGLNDYMIAAFGTLAGVPVWLMVLVIIISVTVISELASNTASAAMVVPVVASIAAAMGVDPLPLVIAATLGASCGYALPVATPPNTIAYATGHVSVGRMVKAGALLDVVAIGAMYAGVMLLVRFISA
jgi:solute carrier family 13 (sodium-dependent dicarboxylate transporter), member 2/3/5